MFQPKPQWDKNKSKVDTKISLTGRQIRETPQRKLKRKIPWEAKEEHRRGRKPTKVLKTTLQSSGKMMTAGLLYLATKR